MATAVTMDTRVYDQVGIRVTGATQKARREVLAEAREIAIAHCPVSDGQRHGDVHLYETIRIEGVNQYADDLVAGDASLNVLHAPPVEYGTYKMPGYHFMSAAAKHIASNLAPRTARYIR